MTRLSRSLLLIAALLALSVRLLVPAGFMPGNSGGHLVLDICTGHGPLKADLGSKPSREEGGDKAGSDCAFSFNNLLILNDNIAIFLAVALLLLIAVQLFSVSFVSLTQRLRPPLRGPPLV